MDIRYNNYLWSKIIYDEIVKIGDEKANYPRLHNSICKEVESKKEMLLDPVDDFIEQTVAAYLMYELMSFEKQVGLEGVGLISYELPKPKWWNESISICGFNHIEVWDIMVQFFNGLRTYRAVEFPSDLRSNHSIFRKRTKPMYFRYSGSNRKLGIMSLKPKDKYSNMRLDYLLKIFIKRGLSKENAREKADEFFEKILNDNGLIKLLIGEGIYKASHIRNEGEVYQLGYEKWFFNVNKKVYMCSKCGQKARLI
jgi:hypothetical protein